MVKFCWESIELNCVRHFARLLSRMWAESERRIRAQHGGRKDCFFLFFVFFFVVVVVGNFRKGQTRWVDWIGFRDFGWALPRLRRVMATGTPMRDSDWLGLIQRHHWSDGPTDVQLAISSTKFLFRLVRFTTRITTQPKSVKSPRNWLLLAGLQFRWPTRIDSTECRHWNENITPTKM